MDDVIQQIQNYYRDANEFIQNHPGSNVFDLLKYSIKEKAELIQNLRGLQNNYPDNSEERRSIDKFIKYFSQDERNTGIIIGLTAPNPTRELINTEFMRDNNMKMEQFSTPQKASQFIDTFELIIKEHETSPTVPQHYSNDMDTGQVTSKKNLRSVC